MRIGIDGFNLRSFQGTGLATYGKTLSTVLASGGHQVFPLYGISGIDNDPQIAWAQFLQKLVTEQELSRNNHFRLALLFVRYIHYYLAGLPVTARLLCNNEQMINTISTKNLPPFKALFNLPGIFRAAQVYSGIFSRSLQFRFPIPLDIFHLTFPVPLKPQGAKLVVTAHDIIPLLLPTSTDVRLVLYKKMIEMSFEMADIIFAISEQTKRDLISYLEIPEEKIVVTYQSVDIPKNFLALEYSEIETYLWNMFQLKQGKYFLYYGAIEPKKNVARIIEAMCSAKTEYPLIIVGKDGWLFDDVKKILEQMHQNPAIRHRIRRVEYLPFNQLMYLLKGARALLFPSLYEGFGLPILEAMEMGCPVITSNCSAIPEICGEAALLVDPTNISEISLAIDKLAIDDFICKELVQKGKVQAEKFSQERYLDRLNIGYEKILQKNQ